MFKVMVLFKLKIPKYFYRRSLKCISFYCSAFTVLWDFMRLFKSKSSSIKVVNEISKRFKKPFVLYLPAFALLEVIVDWTIWMFSRFVWQVFSWMSSLLKTYQNVSKERNIRFLNYFFLSFLFCWHFS